MYIKYKDSKIRKNGTSTVAHTCNPRLLGGIVLQDGRGQLRQKIHETLSKSVGPGWWYMPVISVTQEAQGRRLCFEASALGKNATYMKNK
jgi:hypothetical protein